MKLRGPGRREQGRQEECAENPATACRAAEKQNRCGLARINPALKSWLDNVVIPNLVRSYLLEQKEHRQPDRPLAINAGRVYARPDVEQKQ